MANYTWGYIKSVTLSKLDLEYTLNDDDQDAGDSYTTSLISRFTYYANEAMTQICSSIKPYHTYAHFVIVRNKCEQKFYKEKFGIDCGIVGEEQKMPDDFICFGRDVCYELVDNPRKKYPYFCDDGPDKLSKELHDSDFDYLGHDMLVFKHPGDYFISYDARWYFFPQDIDSDKDLSFIPADILDCLPSYIASQCYKADDEVKGQIYRNEYELALSRINDTHYANTRTIEIGGNW